MGYIEAIILGLVQGLTEFIPVSSSGHLALTRAILGIDQVGLFYDVLLHLATLIAVLIYFRKKISAIVLRPVENKNTIIALAVATTPIFVIGYFIAGFISSIESSYPLVIVGTLLLTAVVFFIGESIYKKNKSTAKENINTVSVKSAVLIGLGQSIALLPGVSRSGMSMIAGFGVGLSRKTAGEFSFLLSIPAILGAGAYQVLETFQGSGSFPLTGPMVVGAVIAGLSGYGAITYMLKYLEKNSFIPFAWYLTCAAVVLLVIELI